MIGILRVKVYPELKVQKKCTASKSNVLIYCLLILSSYVIGQFINFHSYLVLAVKGLLQIRILTKLRISI